MSEKPDMERAVAEAERLVRESTQVVFPNETSVNLARALLALRDELAAIKARSIVDAVPEGWRISSVMWQPDWAKDSPPRFVANITKGTGRDIGELYIGTGPTPESAVDDAAIKAGGG